MNGGTLLVLRMKSSFFCDLTFDALLVGGFVAEVSNNVFSDVGVIGFVGLSRWVLSCDEVGFVQDSKLFNPIQSVLRGIIVSVSFEYDPLVPTQMSRVNRDSVQGQTSPPSRHRERRRQRLERFPTRLGLLKDEARVPLVIEEGDWRAVGEV